MKKEKFNDVEYLPYTPYEVKCNKVILKPIKYKFQGKMPMSTCSYQDVNLEHDTYWGQNQQKFDRIVYK